MNKNPYIAAAAAAAMLIVSLVLGEMLAGFRTAKLERKVTAAESQAAEAVQTAREKEIKAAGFAEKIRTLEQQLADIRRLAREQDEKLNDLENNSLAARDAVVRLRDLRPIAANAEQLCRQLADLGYPC